MNLRHLAQGAGSLALALGLAACGGDSDPVAAARGDWLYINYWAEWCKPCIREVPELNALDERPGYSVLGVNYDGAVDAALATQIDKLGIAFPTLAEDPAARFAVARPEVLPTTLVISPAGKLQVVLVGPQTEDTLLAASGVVSGDE